MHTDRTPRDTYSASVCKRWPALRPVAENLSLLGAALLVLLPALLGAYLIKRYAVNVIFWDEWELVRLLGPWDAGTWTFADLWAQHNEHRLLFPRLLTIALWHWTHLDTRAGMWATWVMLCLLAAMFYLLIAPRAADRTSALFWFLPISWLLFNWRQSETLLWGIVMAIPLMVLCVVCALYLLERSEGLDRYYCLAMLSAGVGTFSFANGLLIWPIGLVQIIGQRALSRTRCLKHPWVQMGVWSLVGVVVYMLYFRGYYKPGSHPSLLFFVQHPVAAMQYFLIYWGNPLVGLIGVKSDVQVAGGILLVISGYSIAVLLFGQPLSRAALPYFSCILFALLSGGMLVVARAGFGIEQAGAPHYITFSSLGLIGSFALVQLVESDSRRHMLQGMWVGLLLYGALTSYLHGGSAARERWAKMGELAFFLRSASCQPDDRLRQLYPLPDVVRALVPFLEQHHLNVFSGQLRIVCHLDNAMKPRDGKLDPATLAVHPGQTDYAVNLINNYPIGSVTALTMDSHHEPVLTLTGWAVDREAGGPSSGVYINVDGQQDFPAEYGQDRLDVALLFHRPAYWHSGFVASLPVEKLEMGKHLLRLKIIAVDRRQYYWSERTWIMHIR
jgi:hypothetical protein